MKKQHRTVLAIAMAGILAVSPVALSETPVWAAETAEKPGTDAAEPGTGKEEKTLPPEGMMPDIVKHTEESAPDAEEESTPDSEGESAPDAEEESTPDSEGESVPDAEEESTPDSEGESVPDVEEKTAADAEEETAGAAASSEDGVLASGYCGDDEDGGKNIAWVLTNDGKLTLTGEGATAFYNESDEFWGWKQPVPGWYEYRSQVTSVEIGEGITELTSATFSGTNITSVVLPSTLKVLGQVTFSECSRLSQVTLNDGLEEIGTGAFCNTAITSITVPASVKKIAATNFSETRETTSGTEHGLPIENWIFSDDPDANLRVVDKVLYSGNMDTILYCDPDVSGTFTMPDSVETVADQAFENCRQITELKLSANLKKVGFYSFFWCNGVTDLYIPDSVTDTDTGAFGEMHGLKSVSIGTGMTKIGTLCFLRSYALTDVTFRGKPTAIGLCAFESCRSLTEIRLPDSVQTIGQYAFADTALGEITIPDSVTAIGENAFPSTTKIISTSMIDLGNGKYAGSQEATKISYPVTYDQDGARDMLALVNAFRTGNDAWYWDENDTEKVTVSGLSELQYDYSLEQAAMARAAELAISFSHTRPNGADCFTAIEALQRSYRYEGENIAAGETSVEAAFSAWQEENENYSGQGHRRNMLESGFNAIGIAHVSCGGTDFWVQEFGYASSPDTDQTPAVNDTQVFYTAVKNEDATAYTVGSAAPAALRLTPGGTSAEADVPTVEVTGVRLYGTVGSALTVTAYPNWKVQDAAVASLSDGKVTAVKGGETSLAGYAFGQKVEVPVSVAASVFTDISSRLYCCDAVNWAAENNIAMGYKNADGTWKFEPNGECTRGHAVTFLWKLAGHPAPKTKKSPFKDVGSKNPFYKAILWGYENDFVKGYGDKTFRPNQACTRSDIMLFLWRYAGRPTAKGGRSFTDVPSTAAYYKAVKWGAGAGITVGYSDKTFRPDQKCTRGQIIQFLYRYAHL